MFDKSSQNTSATDPEEIGDKTFFIAAILAAGSSAAAEGLSQKVGRAMHRLEGWDDGI